MSLDQNIENALTAQDVELANALANLKNDPVKLSEFVSTRKAALYNSITAQHSDSFQKVYGDLKNANDTVKNLMYYHVRNKDLNTTQQAIFDKAKAQAGNAVYDSQNAKRQFEINEWTANNKRDTLFVFQLMFIGLTLTVPLLYLNRQGMLPGSVLYGVLLLIVIAIVFTLVIRAQYTNKSRDTRFWNRRRFASMGGPPVTMPPTCEPTTGATETTSAAETAAPVATA